MQDLEGNGWISRLLQRSDCRLLRASHSLLDPEAGGNMSLRNVGLYSKFAALQPSHNNRRDNLKSNIYLCNGAS
jgi:hypothetical protein